MIYNTDTSPRAFKRLHEPGLPFQAYIKNCQELIKARRRDLSNELENPPSEVILEANMPFELFPSFQQKENKKYKYGALLIHGMLDCPFSLKDVGLQLQKHGGLSRSILLPGHGTTPADLLNIHYHDWIETLNYGIQTMQNDVDKLFLIGYSTGATLSIYHAMKNKGIAGIILLAPAIRLTRPVDMLVNMHLLIKWYSKKKQWLFKDIESDYAKYKSIPLNPVLQLNKLMKIIHSANNTLDCPVFISMSQDDETVSCNAALKFFSQTYHENSKFLLYTTSKKNHNDTRIITRPGHYSRLHINHLSHSCIPFSSSNIHYGQHGDYILASRSDKKNFQLGAYNRLEADIYRFLSHFGIVKMHRGELTYNPDFTYLSKQILDFVENTC